MRAAVLPLSILAAFVLGGPANAAPAERVVIPAIGINAPIAGVGQHGGALALGHGLGTAYRWNAGVRPCAPGSLMLAFHAYTVPGGQAIGNRTGGLDRGDTITIQRPGKGCRYQVTTNRVQPASRSVGDCFSFSGRARGCIITCVGRIGPGTYTHRRITRFVRIQ